MATILLARSDRLPVGTSVGIYPAGANQPGQAPTAAAIASATVDSAGLLTVTDAGIVQGATYVAYAAVGGAHNYVRCRSSLDVWSGPGATWKATVAARRTAIGTS